MIFLLEASEKLKFVMRNDRALTDALPILLIMVKIPSKLFLNKEFLLEKEAKLNISRTEILFNPSSFRVFPIILRLFLMQVSI